MTKKKESSTLHLNVHENILDLEEERRRAESEEQVVRGHNHDAIERRLIEKEGLRSQRAADKELRLHERAETSRRQLVERLEQRPTTGKRVKRFELGAQLAWMLDIEGGYRGTRLKEWSFQSVDKLRGGKPPLLRRWASIDLGQIAPNRELPKVIVEPGPDEMFRVTSSVGLAVQPFGETKASAAGCSVELPYGSVIRVGPLLFSIVHDVQAASIREGRLTLPHIEAGLDVSPRVLVSGVGPELLRRARQMARRRLLLIAALLLLVVGIGVAAHVLYRPTVDPRKVLVLVEGLERGLARDLADRCSARLADAGFEPIALTVVEVPPVGGDQLAGLQAAAQKQLAGSILLVSLDVVEEHPGLTPRSSLLIARATARLQSVTTPIERPLHVVTLGGEAVDSTSDRDRSLHEAGLEMIRTLSHAVVAELVGTTAHPGFFSRVPSDERQAVMEARRMAEDQAQERANTKRLYEESCERVRVHLEPDQAEIPTLLAKALSGPCFEEYPIGLATDGSYAVVQVETKEPYFTLTAPSHVRSVQSPERIDIVPLDGGERQTLATAGDFFSFGAHVNGRVYVVQAFWARFGLVEIDIATGERRVLHLVERPEQIRGPLPSPDGEWVIIWKEDESSEREHPLLLRTDGGEPVGLDSSIMSFSWVELEPPEEEGESSGPRLFIAATTRRVAESANPNASEFPEDAVELIDPATRQVVARLANEHIETLREVVGVAYGSLLFVHQRRSYPCSLGSWRPWSSENPLALTPLPRCVRYPQMMSNDDIIARAVITTADDPNGSDDEIVHVNPRSGAITPLTVNSADDRFVTTNVGTTRVVFGRVLPTYYSDLPRVVVMVADLGE